MRCRRNEGGDCHVETLLSAFWFIYHLFSQTRLLVKRFWATPSSISIFTILAKICVSILPLIIIWRRNKRLWGKKIQMCEQLPQLGIKMDVCSTLIATLLSGHLDTRHPLIAVFYNKLTVEHKALSWRKSAPEICCSLRKWGKPAELQLLGFSLNVHIVCCHLPWFEGGPSQVHGVQSELISGSTGVTGVRISSITLTATTTPEICTSWINITCIKWA